MTEQTLHDIDMAAQVLVVDKPSAVEAGNTAALVGAT
jgi:hypothetical protein